MEVLWRVWRSVAGGAGLDGLAGRSMRRTEAPASARRRPAKGPGGGGWLERGVI